MSALRLGGALETGDVCARVELDVAASRSGATTSSDGAVGGVWVAEKADKVARLGGLGGDVVPNVVLLEALDQPVGVAAGCGSGRLLDVHAKWVDHLDTSVIIGIDDRRDVKEDEIIPPVEAHLTENARDIVRVVVE